MVLIEKVDFLKQLIENLSISFMKENLFHDLPQNYKLKFNQIQGRFAQKIYSKFKFLYFPFMIINEKKAKTKSKISSLSQENIESYLFNQLKNFKFITYQFVDFDDARQFNNRNESGLNSNSSFNIVDIVICVEGNCIIIEKIYYSIINSIINNLNKQGSSIINTRSKIISKNELHVKEELKNFCKNEFLQDNIQNNEFVKKTIKPIACYLIRRYFYPTEYFKDPSFFYIYKTNVAKERSIKSELIDLLKTPKNRNRINKLLEIREQFSNIKYEVINLDFNENDFIVLREIYINSTSKYSLVIHIETLYIFLLKKLFNLSELTSEIKHEIYFCENYTHRCFTQFYGFLKNNGIITGFFYEFMCNESLHSYVCSHREKINEKFSLMVMNRIFQGIEFLYSNYLIHRDLKPSNILLDHDYLPYIYDFETIRPSIDNKNDKEKVEMTENIGSSLYSSPEQNRGEIVSYSTDIYSFGLIVYFLIEKKNIFSKYSEIVSMKNEDFKFPSISTCLNNIQYIYKKCVSFKSEERLKNSEIKPILIEEMNSLFANESKQLKKTTEINDFIYENFLIQINENNENQFKNFIIIFVLLFSRNEESDVLLNLGFLYKNGYGVKQDYSKAKKYFELSAKLGNSDALNILGNIYEKGYGLSKDYKKAMEYYELSSKLGNSDALNNLGNLYFYGFGVEKNYSKAKEYYELSSKFNNSTSFFNLGILFQYGQGVKQDYLKAIEYYELSSKLNNSAALNNLGFLYIKGCGVKRDYMKAKEYFESSVKYIGSNSLTYFGELYMNEFDSKTDFYIVDEFHSLSTNINNSCALFNLGNLYENCCGIKKDYLKAFEYYELSSQHNNSNALNKLGNFYLKGCGVQKDYLKAKEYYELSSKLNNSDALFNLGELYEKGIGVEQNFLKAKKYYKLSSKLNNSNALNKLGQLYIKGIGVKQNCMKAKKYFELSSKLNNSTALYNLGNFYFYGYGVKQDYSEAKKYYELSSKQNNANALNKLGEIYENKYGVEQDYLKAKKYYELASKQNESTALNHLGNFYYYGYGVKQDYSKAKEYYELSSKQNNSTALFNLGVLFQNGQGVKQDYLKAIQYYEESAKLNNSDALNNLGILYENGYGVKQDYLKAKEYYEKASKLNNSAAFNKLGNLYFYGYGVKKDHIKAIEYFEISSQKGYLLSILNLGILYSYGYGTKRDYLRAKEYYEFAAKHNNSFAFKELGYFYENGFGVPQNYSKAKKYYKLSANLKNSEALFKLGQLYYHGYDSIKQNYLKSKKYFKLSAKLNNSEALFELGELYYHGNGVERNYIKAKKYYILSSKFNNYNAFFALANLYSNLNFVDFDVQKSIYFYSKCIESRIQLVKNYNPRDHQISYEYVNNKYFYHSYNNLGLIYILIFNDVKKATQFIKEAAFAEFPFGQNNYGLLNEFYLNNIENAEHMYERSSKHHFAMAEFNLAHLKEKENNIDESIEFYIKASEDENEPLVFHNNKYYDKRLEISKIFVICYANLKLAEFFLSKSKNVDSKKYFNKAFSKLKINEKDLKYEFQFRFVKENNFSYLKTFILCFPLFNLMNQQHLKVDLKNENYNNNLFLMQKEEKENIVDIKENFSTHKKINKNKENHFSYSKNQADEFIRNLKFIKSENKNNFDIEITKNPIKQRELKLNSDETNETFVFTEPNDLFDFVIKNEQLKKSFIKEIKDILNIMNKILYTPPYNILFGRIDFDGFKTKESNSCTHQEINKYFYEGFGEDLL